MRLSELQRVCFVGASTTIQKESFSKLLSSQWSQAPQKIETMTAAVGGVGIHVTGALIASRYLDIETFRPQLTLIDYSVTDDEIYRLISPEETPRAWREHVLMIEFFCAYLRSIGSRIAFIHSYKKIPNPTDWTVNHRVNSNEIRIAPKAEMRALFPHLVLGAYEEVAARDNIPIISVARHFHELISSGQEIESGLIQDSVHVTARGGQIAAKYIQARLQEINFDDSATIAGPYLEKPLTRFFKAPLPSGGGALPKTLRTNLISADYVEYPDFSQISFEAVEGYYPRTLVYVAGPRSGHLNISLGAISCEVPIFDQYCGIKRICGRNFPVRLPGGHAVMVSLNPKEIDYTLCLKHTQKKLEQEFKSYLAENMETIHKVKAGELAKLIDLVGIIYLREDALDGDALK